MEKLRNEFQGQTRTRPGDCVPQDPQGFYFRVLGSVCQAEDEARDTTGSRQVGMIKVSGRGSSAGNLQITVHLLLRKGLTLTDLALTHASVLRVATTVYHCPM